MLLTDHTEDHSPFQVQIQVTGRPPAPQTKFLGADLKIMAEPSYIEWGALAT